MGCELRGLAKPVTQVLVQTHAAILSVIGRAGCRKMCWMLCSLLSPKTIRIRMRRSIKVGTATPHSTRFGSSWPEPNVNGPCLFQ